MTLKLTNMTVERLLSSSEYALTAVKRHDIILWLGVSKRSTCLNVSGILVSDGARQILNQGPFDIEVLMISDKTSVMNERDKMYRTYKPILNHPKYNLYKNMRGLRIKCVETGQIFKNQQAVADVYGVTLSAVTNVLRGYQAKLGGHTFTIDDSYL